MATRRTLAGAASATLWAPSSGGLQGGTSRRRFAQGSAALIAFLINMDQNGTVSRRQQRDEEFRRGALRDAGLGWTMTADLLAGILAWGGIGWLLDSWLRTGPWMLAGGVLLGFALGTYLVILRADADDEAGQGSGRGH